MSDVQRDYVFGWLIAGLFGQSMLGESMVLKGGNALRKGYMPATRFSADIDLSTANAVNPDWLITQLNDVCRFASEKSGVQFDIDRNRVADVQGIDHERRVFKIRLYFHDFSGKADYLTLKVRVDVTEFERLLLPPQSRHLIHQYSDADECRAEIRCVALEEVLADKLKCLLQRRYSHDLFDLVYGVFVDQALDVDRRLVMTTFLRKTIFEPSPPAALQLLLAVPFEAMRYFWDKIICPQASRLSFERAVGLARDGLVSLFQPFSYGRHLAGAFFPAEVRDPILRAGSELTLLQINYDGVMRFAEPYSLVFKRRKTDGVAQEYLYVYDRTGGRGSGPGIKSWFWHGIRSIENTDTKFEPRANVELSKAGDRDSVGDFSAQSRAGQARRGHRSAFAGTRPLAYRVACPFCRKSFPRTKPSTRLNPHADGYGNRCPGRIGQLL